MASQLGPADYEGIASAVQQALRKAPIPVFLPGVVAGIDPESNLAEVQPDGPDQPVHGAQLLAGAVFPGDRVLIMYVAPTAAYVIGRRGGDYDNWHLVGNPGEPAFAAGWSRAAGTNVIGSDDPAYPAFRKLYRLVELRGRAQASGGTDEVFRLPPDYRPENDLIIPCVGNLGGLITCSILRDGRVFAQTGEDFIVFDGVMFSTNPTAA